MPQECLFLGCHTFIIQNMMWWFQAPQSHGVFQPSTEKQREGTADGRNPAPPGMYKTL